MPTAELDITDCTQSHHLWVASVTGIIHSWNEKNNNNNWCLFYLEGKGFCWAETVMAIQQGIGKEAEN